MQKVEMKPNTMHDRLRIARQQAGYRSASEAVVAFGWRPSTYRAHENGQNPFRPSDAQEYAKAFDVSAAWLLTGESKTGPSSTEAKAFNSPARQKLPTFHKQKPTQSLSKYTENVNVCGYVATGIWRDPFLDNDPDLTKQRTFFAADPNYPLEAHFDLIVENNSLNRFARNGDRIRCVDINIARIDVEDGDLVVIERHNGGGLREVSAKRLRRLANRFEFWPESDEEFWQTEILVKDLEQKIGENIKIVAKVIWAYRASQKL
jgi:phage repressor protein C with HTH and peptisase S24 domain